MGKPFLTALLLILGAPALAESPPENRNSEPEFEKPRLLDVDYTSGVARHELGGDTRVTGWRLSDSWYFGKQKGAAGGLALVWQGQRDQMSFSTTGLKLTRRF